MSGDVLGAVPAFIFPSHNNFYETGTNHLHFIEDDLGTQGVDRAGPRHLARRAAPEFESRSSGCENANPLCSCSRRVLARGPGSREPRGPARPEPRPHRGRPHRENQLPRCARIPQLQAAPLGPAGSPRLLGVASGSHGAPGHHNFAGLCHRPESGAVTSLRRAARPPGSATQELRGYHGNRTAAPRPGQLHLDALWLEVVGASSREGCPSIVECGCSVAVQSRDVSRWAKACG